MLTKKTRARARAQAVTNTQSTFSMQIFDAGEKLFIALVEQDGSADDASEAGEGEEGGGGTEDRATPSLRKVVVRDDYVEDGEENGDIFLVDRECNPHSTVKQRVEKPLQRTGKPYPWKPKGGIHPLLSLFAPHTTDAWTFQPGSAREQLRSSEPLLQRMAALMQVPEREKEDNDCAEVEPEDKEESGAGDAASDSSRGDDGTVGHRERRDEEERARVLEGVLTALPTFSRRYGLGRAGLHVSYVNDELGSAFRHSESPNHQASTQSPGCRFVWLSCMRWFVGFGSWRWCWRCW